MLLGIFHLFVFKWTFYFAYRGKLTAIMEQSPYNAGGTCREPSATTTGHTEDVNGQIFVSFRQIFNYLVTVNKIKIQQEHRRTTDQVFKH